MFAPPAIHEALPHQKACDVIFFLPNDNPCGGCFLGIRAHCNVYLRYKHNRLPLTVLVWCSFTEGMALARILSAHAVQMNSGDSSLPAILCERKRAFVDSGNSLLAPYSSAMFATTGDCKYARPHLRRNR